MSRSHGPQVPFNLTLQMLLQLTSKNSGISLKTSDVDAIAMLPLPLLPVPLLSNGCRLHHLKVGSRSLA